MTVIRIEMTEEQFEKLIDMLMSNGICPADIGFKESAKKCIYPTKCDCNKCRRAALKPETIPDKGKEG